MKKDGKEDMPDSVMVDLDSPFMDSRGEILPLLNKRIESCVLIRSQKGAVRANHYHKTDWHYCYVMSGSIEYFYRPHGTSDKPRKILVKQGQMFFTPPLTDHAMVFPEETVFITFGGNSRRRDAYEEDLVRIPPIHNI